MDQPRQNLLSAQVVVKNTAKHDIGRVMEAFKNAGYSVGPAVANNFSITGSRSLFQPKSTKAAQGHDAELEKNSEAFVLGSVHPSVRNLVEGVVFPKPPDFGPGAAP
jgi:hypothetical protein